MKAGSRPFAVDVTDKLSGSGENAIVDLRRQPSSMREAVPTDYTDWQNYGGVTRSVWLVETARRPILPTGSFDWRGTASLLPISRSKARPRWGRISRFVNFSTGKTKLRGFDRRKQARTVVG